MSKIPHDPNKIRNITPSSQSKPTESPVIQASKPVQKNTNKSASVDYTHIPYSSNINQSSDIAKIVSETLKQSQITAPAGLIEKPAKTPFQSEIALRIKANNDPIPHALQ